ncbi:MAG: L,D-transpeptidase [Negativicutes bacterium]|nr:L,D-transpeptidase [Negativicutes bacterium]
MRILLCLLLILYACTGTCMAQQEIHINIPAYILELVDSDSGNIIKQYNIAVGTPYEQTPIGTFSIFYKEKEPTWTPGLNFTDRNPVPPGPDNPLGTRWMEFKRNYGIHGTNKGWDISYPVSGGCIRMQDADARELFDFVDIGTPVIIGYETMIVNEKLDGLYLKVYPDIYNRQTNLPERLLELYQNYRDKYQQPREPHILKTEFDTAYEVKIAVPLKK